MSENSSDKEDIVEKANAAEDEWDQGKCPNDMPWGGHEVDPDALKVCWIAFGNQVALRSNLALIKTWKERIVKRIEKIDGLLSIAHRQENERQIWVPRHPDLGPPKYIPEILPKKHEEILSFEQLVGAKQECQLFLEFLETLEKEMKK